MKEQLGYFCEQGQREIKKKAAEYSGGAIRGSRRRDINRIEREIKTAVIHIRIRN